YTTLFRSEAGREGPGLAGEVLDLADVDADVLVDLAAHRLLDGLAGLDEPGERREAALRPVDLAAEEDAVVLVDHGHDHGGVGARVVLGTAGGAAPDVAGGGDDGAFAAA